MDEIDTANHKDFSMNGLSKVMGMKGDSAHDEDFQKAIKQLNAQMQHTNLITHLAEKRKGIIDIEVSVKKDEKQSAKNNDSTKAESKEVQAMVALMTDGVMLRGSLYEDGTIESFYTKNDQKNLLAMFFELPGKAIKPGDTWSLSVNFLSMDQNFVCDSSFKRNIVTLVGIENKNGEHIASIKYDVNEYVCGNFMNTKTSMKMTFQGTLDFHLKKGDGWFMMV
jgi:hypothetical protein